MTSHEERRMERIGVIKRSLDNSKNPDIEKLIAMGCVEWGCSRRTMLEYIKVVQIYNGK